MEIKEILEIDEITNNDMDLYFHIIETDETFMYYNEENI